RYLSAADLRHQRDDVWVSWLCIWVIEVFTFGTHCIATQLVPAGHRPYVSSHAPVIGQDLGCFDDPWQRNTRAKEVGLWSANIGLRVPVDAAYEAIDIDVFWFWLVGDWLVVHGDVVHNVADTVTQIVITVHFMQSVAHNMCNLVGERGIIVLHTGVGASQDW